MRPESLSGDTTGNVVPGPVMSGFSIWCSLQIEPRGEGAHTFLKKGPSCGCNHTFLNITISLRNSKIIKDH